MTATEDLFVVAKRLQKLEKKGLSQRAIAEQAGSTQTRVSFLLKLDDLSAAEKAIVRRAIKKKKFSWRAAEYFAKVEDKETRAEVLRRLKAGDKITSRVMESGLRRITLPEKTLPEGWSGYAVPKEVRLTIAVPWKAGDLRSVRAYGKTVAAGWPKVVKAVRAAWKEKSK